MRLLIVPVLAACAHAGVSAIAPQAQPMRDTMMLTWPGDRTQLAVDDGTIGQPRGRIVGDATPPPRALHGSGPDASVAPQPRRELADLEPIAKPRSMTIVSLEDGRTCITRATRTVAWRVGNEVWHRAMLLEGCAIEGAVMDGEHRVRPIAYRSASELENLASVTTAPVRYGFRVGDTALLEVGGEVDGGRGAIVVARGAVLSRSSRAHASSTCSPRTTAGCGSTSRTSTMNVAAVQSPRTAVGCGSRSRARRTRPPVDRRDEP
jgi:hypothetical protein